MKRSTYSNRSKKKSYSQWANPADTDYGFQKDDNTHTYVLQRQASQRTRSSVGPGSYEIQSPAHLQLNRPKISIGKGFRSQFTKINNPGPGQYNISSSQHSKTFVFNSRPASANCSKSPGPGTYDLTSQSSRSVSFGTARKMLFFDPQLNTPGPGAYKINVKVEKKKVDRIERLLKPKVMVRSYYDAKEDKALQEKKAQQAKQQRPKSANFIKQEARRRKITQSRKYHKLHEKHLGPGSYEIKDFIQVDNICEKKSGVTQPQKHTERIQQDAVLGPGTYHLKNFLDQSEYMKKGVIGLGFGTSRRFQELKVNNELGPGSYDIIDEYNY